jgi:hypothetical protein
LRQLIISPIASSQQVVGPADAIAKCMPSAEDQARRHRRQVAAEIAKLGPCLPGSLVDRTTRCRSPTCRCHKDPAQLHGPSPSWIRKVNNKTVTRALSADQAERYRPLFANTKRLRELVAEIEVLSARAVEEAEGWDQR